MSKSWKISETIAALINKAKAATKDGDSAERDRLMEEILRHMEDTAQRHVERLGYTQSELALCTLRRLQDSPDTDDIKPILMEATTEYIRRNKLHQFKNWDEVRPGDAIAVKHEKQIIGVRTLSKHAEMWNVELSALDKNGKRPAAFQIWINQKNFVTGVHQNEPKTTLLFFFFSTND